jgi:hypothetical protein
VAPERRAQPLGLDGTRSLMGWCMHRSSDSLLLLVDLFVASLLFCFVIKLWPTAACGRLEGGLREARAPDSCKLQAAKLSSKRLSAILFVMRHLSWLSAGPPGQQRMLSAPAAALYRRRQPTRLPTSKELAARCSSTASAGACEVGCDRCVPAPALPCQAASPAPEFGCCSACPATTGGDAASAVLG